MSDKSISKYTLESILLYQYKIIRGLVITIIVTVCILFATIIAGIWYISLPIEEVTETVTQDSSGDDNTLIGIGDNYGQADSN